MPTFDHVLLTRFSVRFLAEQPPPDDDWLVYRWGFFRDALASSLSHQTVRDFRWLVFCDASSPEWLREEMEALAPGLFTPVWLDEPWSHSVIRDAVTGVLSQDDYLITTRIDSDDAVGIRFIEEVQSHFDGQESMYINLLRGVQVARSGQVFRYDEPLNPFISYVEKLTTGTPMRTVFQDFRHAQSQRHAPVLNVVTAPRWMQVVHGSNLANSIRGLRADPRIVNEEFTLELPYTRDVRPLTLFRERQISRLWLLKLWIRYPYFADEAARTRRERRQGTAVLPQTDKNPMPRYDALKRMKDRIFPPKK
ncbi:hypothetical protein J2Y69_000475 [Microbacterium resistens]|uniref:Rhamnosyltransferase n=1 Tax=Microbacterium resistens TaxID=156977 RepID=A0ABU1S8K9_9MICO|nr:glycosyltransferase [Microbacterium resistens]MDR6865890.1 hypothetical protein [Microbacterium resistens]